MLTVDVVCPGTCKASLHSENHARRSVAEIGDPVATLDVAATDVQVQTRILLAVVDLIISTVGREICGGTEDCNLLRGQQRIGTRSEGRVQEVPARSNLGAHRIAHVHHVRIDISMGIDVVVHERTRGPALVRHLGEDEGSVVVQVVRCNEGTEHSGLYVDRMRDKSSASRTEAAKPATAGSKRSSACQGMVGRV